MVPASRLATNSRVAVAVGVDAVGARAGGQEPLDLQGVGVDDPDAVAEHVGGQEPGAVGGEADVLGHGAGAGAQPGLGAAASAWPASGWWRRGCGRC